MSISFNTNIKRENHTIQLIRKFKTPTVSTPSWTLMNIFLKILILLTFISPMICWKSPPSAEHSLSRHSGDMVLGMDVGDDIKSFQAKELTKDPLLTLNPSGSTVVVVVSPLSRERKKQFGVGIAKAKNKAKIGFDFKNNTSQTLDGNLGNRFRSV